MSRKKEWVEKLDAVYDKFDEAVNDGLRGVLMALGDVISEIENEPEPEPEPEDDAPDFDGEEYSREVYILDESYIELVDGPEAIDAPISLRAIMPGDRAYVLREEADANVQAWKDEFDQAYEAYQAVSRGRAQQYDELWEAHRQKVVSINKLLEDVDALAVEKQVLHQDLDREYDARVSAERELDEMRAIHEALGEDFDRMRERWQDAERELEVEREHSARLERTRERVQREAPRIFSPF